MIDGCEQIDYKLTVHYDTVKDCHDMKPNGYIVKFCTKNAIEFVSEELGINAEFMKQYKTEDKEVFDKIRLALESNKSLVGLFGDDSWPLYALLNKEYWTSLYGGNYIEEHGPYGPDYYKKIEDLKFYCQ